MPFIFTPAITIREALRQATDFLDDHGVAESRLAVEWLLSRALGCARLELPLRQDAGLAPAIQRLLESQVNRLSAREPLQYIQAEAEFMGRVFMTDRRSLIPRPETEQLVEIVLACAPLWKLPHPAIADVGAGGGCIVISLALARPQGCYQAIDRDPAALELARENVGRLDVRSRIRFTTGDLLDGLSPASLDAVVSNPPYVRTEDWARLPPIIRDHEPRLALDGGADGLAVIRPLLAQAIHVLRPAGRLFLEIGESQEEAVRRELAKHGFQEIAVRPDNAGKTRFASARR
jgi:release factor glutamine methyltransferase